MSLSVQVLADECFKVKEPQARIIYLHGMDLKNHTENEKKRRVLLKKLAKRKILKYSFHARRCFALKIKICFVGCGEVTLWLV